MFIDFNELGPKLTKQDILDKVSEEQIYKAWCADFPKKIFKRPWPGESDKNPSFGFYKKGHCWRWKDLARDESGDCFDFVARMERLADFNSVLAIIAQRFFITAGYKTSIVVKSKFDQNAYEAHQSRERSLIQVVRRTMLRSDYNWWNRILITPQILDLYLARAAKEVWVDKKLYWFHKDNNPIYYYLSPLSSNVKAYRPLEPNPKRKWLSNMDNTKDVQGYAQCEIKRFPGRPLLLVKSMKDIMFFRAFHINAMAINGEGHHFDPDFIRHIKKYCFPILSLYDNDMAGYKGALNLKVNYQIPSMFICEKWGSKDPTDLWLANYRKVYDLLNLIHEHFKFLRASGGSVTAARQLRLA